MRKRSRSGVQLTGLKVYTVGRTEYVYHRATNTRLPPLDDPRFLDAYKAAERGTKPPSKADTLAAAIDIWRRSDAFAALAPATQQWQWRVARKLHDKYGHVPTDQIKARHITKDIDAKTPQAANNRLKVWRSVFKMAHRKGLVPVNEAALVVKQKTPKTRGHIPWAQDEIATYRAHWKIGTMQRNAFEILYWTGARVVDACRLSGDMVDDDGFLVFDQTKTGNSCTVPIRVLPEWMHALRPDFDLMRQCLPNGHLITTGTGEARTQKGLSQWLAASAREAGLQARTAHGLRKSRSIALAEAGFTTLQMRSWVGHEDLASLEVYIREASKKRVLLSSH